VDERWKVARQGEVESDKAPPVRGSLTPRTGPSNPPVNSPLRRDALGCAPLYQAVADDAITEAEGWEAYKVGVKLRHGFVHRALDVPKDDAARFVDAAEQVLTHIAYVMSTVTVLRAASES
jgi:hypothetical protein